MVDMGYYDTLARLANRKMAEIESMSEEEREKYVMDVVRWISKMFDDISEAAAKGGMLKATKVANRYKKELMDLDKRATAIACLKYAIKEPYRDYIGKILIGVLSMF